MGDPQFDMQVDGDQEWGTCSEFAEYDIIHAVAGAILAGADTIVIERQAGDQDG